MMTVYVDLLFIVNLMINTLMLAGACVLARERLHRIRLLLGAGLGALYCVLMFFPEIEYLFRLGLRLAVGAVMVWIAIPTPNLKRYFRALFYFCICLAVFGGGMYLFYAFTAAGAEMIYSNGIYYVDLPLWLLLLLSFTFYGLIRLVALIQSKRHPVEGLVEIEICCKGRYRTVSAMLDTGNSLQDPLSLAPVIIVEASALRGMLPEEICSAVRMGETMRLEELAAQYKHLKCRLLPYRDVQGESKLLFAIRPQWVRRLPDGEIMENILLGLTDAPLSEAGEYHALLHIQMK